MSSIKTELEEDEEEGKMDSKRNELKPTENNEDGIALDIDNKSNDKKNDKTTSHQEQQHAPTSIKEEEEEEVAIRNKEKKTNKKVIKNISIETMFYPKFYDYHEKKLDVASIKYKSSTTSQKYYLELSTKHSGSLLLWNGYHYIYSKNSIDNLHTLVGHVLLLQHFERVWMSEGGGVGRCKWEECSQHLRGHNLSIQLEIVTSSLGHHGEIPARDYIIVLGICSTREETFWDTCDVIAFCRKYKLPWNEYWVALVDTHASSCECNSCNLLSKVIAWYELHWEDMYYFSACEFLNHGDLSGMFHHIDSMHPHDVYQGQLLEGLVLRYVPYDDRELRDELLMEDRILQLQHACAHHEPIADVDATIRTGEEGLLSNTNIRDLLEKRGRSKNEMERILRDLLYDYYHHPNNNAAPKEQQQQAVANKNYFCKVEGSTLSKITSSMISLNLLPYYNNQTGRIIQLLSCLDTLKIVYNFRVFREILDQNSTLQEEDEVLYCMIHIPFDKVYHLYNQRKSDDMMTLYRGFCIRIVFTDDAVSSIHQPPPEENSPPITKTTNSNRSKSEFYMIKLKFLPYVIRTVACREGIQYITKQKNKNNAHGYEMYMTHLMNKKWNLSNAARQKWHPFLFAWGRYMNHSLSSNTTTTSTASTINPVLSLDRENDPYELLPPITDQNYLFHFERFLELYESGAYSSTTTAIHETTIIDNGNTTENPTSSSSLPFNGILFLVGPNLEQINSLSKYLMHELHCQNTTCVDITNFDELTILNSLIVTTNTNHHNNNNTGRICPSVVTQNIPNKYKSFLSKYKQSMYVVLIGCTEPDIHDYISNASLPLQSKEQKKLFGMAHSWRKRKESVHTLVDIKSSSYVYQPNDDTWGIQGNDISDLLKAIHQSSTTLQTTLTNNTINDKRKGLLLFFPGIPGCGKTTLSNCISSSSLSNLIPDFQSSIKREIIINTSDHPKTIQQKKEKYWKSVLLEKILQPSSIYVCDKNSPPSIWNDIGNICYKTNSVAVCAIPCGKAFTTTELKLRGTSTFGSGEMVVYYPFSLHYLAFCMNNVLHRTQSDMRSDAVNDVDHTTASRRLDANNDEFVCMTIIQFFSFYKNLTAEKFKDLFLMKMQKESAMFCPDFIFVPIFKGCFKKLPLLPYEIEIVLRDALTLQLDIDAKQQQSTVNKKRMHIQSKQEMEHRLKDTFRTFPIDSFLDTIVQKEEISKASFLSQVTECLTKFDEYDIDATDIDQLPQHQPTSSNIKYVSIEIPVEDVYQVLARNHSDNAVIQEFFEQIQYDATSIPKPNATGNTKGYRIYQTHVTMTHSSTSSQEEMIQKYASLENMSISIYINNFYYSNRIAAFGVHVSSTTRMEPHIVVPTGTNQWMHVTLWCGKDENTLMDVEKKEANDLPKMHLINKARQVRFKDPFIVTGTLKLVMEEN